MKKYSKRVIFDYINGNDIPYDIDEVENDPEFMIEAIKISKDKNLYALCGDDVKNNVSFLLDLIKIFSNDDVFLAPIISTFVKNVDIKCEDRVIVAIAFSDHINFDPKKDEHIDLYGDIFLFLNLVYSELRFDFETSKMKSTASKESKKSLGLGFTFYLEDFNYNDYIKRFIAERMSSELICNSKNFIEYLNRKYKDYNHYSKDGFYKCVHGYILENDECLAGFIEKYPDVLDKEKKNINFILEKWRIYLKDTLDRTLDLIEEYDRPSVISETEIGLYVGIKTKYQELIDYYDSDIELETGEIFECSGIIDSELFKTTVSTLDNLNDPELDELITKVNKIKNHKELEIEVNDPTVIMTNRFNQEKTNIIQFRPRN